jgi:hypothetical protein
MPGISLRGNVGASFGAPTFLSDTSSRAMSSPPVAAAVPPSLAASPRGQTISARAFGVSTDTSGGNVYSSTGMVSTYVGTAAIVLLFGLWWSLPR